MYKRSKLLLALSVLQLLLVAFSLLMYLMDLTSKKYLISFIITLLLTALFFACFILVHISENRALQNLTFNDCRLEVVKYDHLHLIRNLLEEKEISNSIEEKELIRKYEEIVLTYERKARFYLVFKLDEPVALFEVIRNFKHKTISFKLIKSNLEDMSDIYTYVALKENKKIMS